MIFKTLLQKKELCLLMKEKKCFKIVPENHDPKKEKDKALDNSIVFPDQAIS